MSSDPTAESAAAAWYCPSCEREYPTALAACPSDGTRLVRVTDRDPLIGQTLDDRYVIRERLGAGGMGVVYRAWQTSVGREVAVKVIRARAGGSTALVKRFLRECKLSSSLSQPSTVTVIDFGQTDDGMLYLVMELLRGRTLGQLIADGPLAPERAVRIAVQICDALEAAHGAGIIHRDLKPANVMVLDEPVGRDPTKVLDFGLAKAIDADESSVTQSGRLVGTPTHLAPEVALGGEATALSDLYALGVMLYEMLAGHTPFIAGEVSTVLMMQAYHTPAALDGDVPDALAAVVERLLAKKPEDRPQTAAELRGLLERAMQAEAPTVPMATRPRRNPPLPSGTASTATNHAMVPTEPPPPSAARRVRLLAGVIALIAAGVIAFVLVRPGARRDRPAAPSGAMGGQVLDAGLDAAAAIAPVDAAVIDASAPPVAVEPSDAAAAPAPIDARKRSNDERPRPVDGGTGAPPPRPPLDAADPFI